MMRATHIPERMTAIVMQGVGGPEVLEARTVVTPRPGTGQILVKVHAAGLNLGDATVLRRGIFPPPDILGLEVAGVVASVGPGVERWKAGDPVCSLLHDGGYAEYCLADAGSTLPIPGGMTMVEAAGLPEAMLTVTSSLFDRGQPKAGETILVHGGAGGIGSFAIQMAASQGLTVFATAGSEPKLDLCRALGATAAFDYRQEDFVAAARKLTGESGIDIILDIMGGDYIRRNLEALAPGGRIIWISFNKGSVAEVDFAPLMFKRALLTGSTLRGRDKAEKAAIAARAERRFWPDLAAGKIRTVVDSVFPLRNAADAHRRIEEGVHAGKIILSVVET